MGIFDKAKDMLRDEQKTDSVLDKAEQFARGKLGEDKADKISRARDAVDERIGDGNRDQGEQNHPERNQQ